MASLHIADHGLTKFRSHTHRSRDQQLGTGVAGPHRDPGLRGKLVAQWPTHGRSTFRIFGSDTARSALCLQEEAEHADSKRSASLHQERSAVAIRRVANVSMARAAEMKRA